LRPDHRSRRRARSNSQKIPNVARTGPLTWLRAWTTSSTLAPVRRGAATAHLVDLPVDVLWPVGRIVARGEETYSFLTISFISCSPLACNGPAPPRRRNQRPFSLSGQ
jgi:hypothetical protein